MYVIGRILALYVQLANLLKCDTYFKRCHLYSGHVECLFAGKLQSANEIATCNSFTVGIADQVHIGQSV